ncbi:hypothetical protein [Dyadobacter sp. CY323]|uniref:hypothetical protein n=1 Tax=Dyadobacter sp. CY323 TaxID=2907302 RepID=UPI001F1C4992|nr:hypothetical protein [Dyadobacter sp. CY323]MCE6988490.1 hypothetical protein [Dyadobacter sp. CY323]
MQTVQNPIDRQSAAEALVAKYVNRDVNLIEVERMYHDMVLRYFRPADGWNPSYEHRLEVLYTAEIINGILRDLWEFGKQE